MAKALGGVIGANPLKEIGWGRLSVADNVEARRWFGETESFTGFHWHGETFSIPAGATPLLASAYCANQAFSLGKHVGFQCHIEMNEAMIREWCMLGRDEIAASLDSPAVQAVEQILERVEDRVAALNAVADQVYREWIKGLDRQ